MAVKKSRKRNKFNYGTIFNNDDEAQFRITPTRLEMVSTDDNGNYNCSIVSITRASLAKALQTRLTRNNRLSSWLEGARVRAYIRPGYPVAVDRVNGIIAIGCQKFSGDTAKMLRTWALAAA